MRIELRHHSTLRDRVSRPYLGGMRVLLVCSLVLVACSDSPSPDDSSVTDASTDVSSDDTSMPMDASDGTVTDAGDAAIADAGVDASDAATCACSGGSCCDGCNYRPNTHVCNVHEPFPRSCTNTSMWCGGRALSLTVSQVTTYCSGSSSGCDGLEDDTSYGVNCSEPTPGDFQQYGVCMPADGPTPARCALSCGN